jgi:hypothetical protein
MYCWIGSLIRDLADVLQQRFKLLCFAPRGFQTFRSAESTVFCQLSFPVCTCPWAFLLVCLSSSARDASWAETDLLITCCPESLQSSFDNACMAAIAYIGGISGQPRGSHSAVLFLPVSGCQNASIRASARSLPGPLNVTQLPHPVAFNAFSPSFRHSFACDSEGIPLGRGVRLRFVLEEAYLDFHDFLPHRPQKSCQYPLSTVPMPHRSPRSQSCHQVPKHLRHLPFSD